MKEKGNKGRPRMTEEEKMLNKNIRFAPAQIVKLSLLGGAKWIRMKVNQAKVK